MKLIKLLSAVIVLLVVVNVTLTNKAVDQSVTVSDLTKDIAQITHENTLLSARIADAGSLTKLRAMIDEAGFVSTPKVASLPGTPAVASR